MDIHPAPALVLPGIDAPAAQNWQDKELYVTGDPSGSMSLLYTDDPKKGDWQAVPAILNGLEDPDFYMDDDGSAYMFWGSSNVYPIKGEGLDPKHRFLPMDQPVPLFHLDEARHGWSVESDADSKLAATWRARG